MNSGVDAGDGAVAVAARIARSVQTTIGWIFWDPGAIERYERLGLPTGFAGPLGYIAARAAPLAPAGPEAVIAAFGSISPLGVRAAFDLIEDPARFMEFRTARDDAVIEGLRRYAPDIEAPLVAHADELWDIVEALPRSGRVLFSTHVAMVRPQDPLLAGWHAVNCLREWRGDTHWAIVTARGLGHAEASILHNAWLGYEPDWLARSRGTSDADIDAGWDALVRRGLAADRRVTKAGIALREDIERETDRLTTTPWEMFGIERTVTLAERLEPPCETLLERVDITAGPNYQPASRTRRSSEVETLG
jgi:hypothetical protein